jgi:hypothetical protein
MSGGIDATHAAQLLAISLATGGVTTATTTYPLYMRLMTSNGSDTTLGTELASGGGYENGVGISLAASLGAPAGQPTASPTVSSTAVITQVNMPAVPSPGLQGTEYWDSASSPARKWWIPLSAAKTTNAGDTFSVAIGALTFTLV